MPTTLHYPVLVWQDGAGMCTAALVDDEKRTAAVGATATDALRQLKEYLDWTWAESLWEGPPDFGAAELLEIKVEVRPEYSHDGRLYPCPEPVTLRVPFVRGRQQDGLGVCSVPTLNLRFTYTDPDTLKGLVAHYAKNALKGLTPRQLADCQAPMACALHMLTIRIPNDPDSRVRFDPARVRTLAVIGNPLTAPGGVRTRFGPAWERDAEVQQLVAHLSQQRGSVLLVGEPGAGKTTVLVNAARKVSRAEPEDQDTRLDRHHRFWLTSAARLVAGMKYLGQWEERCERVIQELAGLNGVLCLENLLASVRIGGQGPLDGIAAFLLPYVQRGELRLVTEATPAEADACRRLLPGLVETFQVVRLAPLQEEQTVRVLEQTVASFVQNHPVKTEAAIAPAAANLFRRFQPYAASPGTPVRFLRDLLGQAIKDRVPLVGVEQVRDRFVQVTGLREELLRDDRPLEHASVRAWLEQRVIGQTAACDVAASVVTTFKAGLNDPQRPLGVLLFCGSTGVGKTALARALSDSLFGHGQRRDRLVRLDLSEYAQPGSAERLLRGPNGGPSPFIQRMRQEPFAVVLLDEIEKADPEVFDVLLNVFDEGRLTDPLGRVTYFRSAILILTSNLGAGKPAPIGFGPTAEPSFENEALTFFRPEFYNRLDAVVTFQPLDAAAIERITRKELAEIAEREGLAHARVRLNFSDRLVDHLARTGFDRRYGARPLQRTIDHLVVAPLARHLLAHAGMRDATLEVDWRGGQAVFEKTTG